MSGKTQSVLKLVEQQIKLYEAINPNIEVDDSTKYVWFNSTNFDKIDDRDNAYPNMLLDLHKNASSTHSNFINLKANLTYGSKGLIPFLSDNVGLSEFLKKKNLTGETLDDVYKKMCKDFAINEAACLQIIYDGFGKVAEIYHTCPSFIRAAKPNQFGYVEHYLYNPTWGIVSNKRAMKPQNQISKSVCIKAFNPATAIEDKIQLLYLKQYVSGHDIYAVPSYNSAIPYIKLDYELGVFHLNKVMNSFSPSVMMYIPFNGPEEDKDALALKLKNKHLGAESAGNIFLMFGDPSATAKPQVERLEADPNADVFETLNDIVVQKIATAHGGSLELAGINEGGVTLGGDANKLNVMRAFFIDNVILGFQDTLIAGLNKVLAINGLGEVTVANDPLALEQPQAEPTDLTEDERRMMIYKLGPKAGAPTSGVTQANVANKEIMNMMGKEWINMERIKRKVKQNKLPRSAGEDMLRSFGLSNEFITQYLDHVEEVEPEETLPQEPNKQLV